jgi:bifunctional pyridoxal-dependent enzyme with beta-cystathionase and maltose regulon repressor activities
VILWENNGKEVKDFSGSVIRNESYYFQEGITWNYVSLASFGSRYVPKGFINNAAGPIIYSKDHLYLMAILNSSTAKEILSIISPTMTFEVGTISSYPIVIDNSVNRENIVKLIKIAEDDWNSFEISWGFSESALLKFQSTLKSNSVPDAYTDLINKRHDSIREMQDLEKENNLFFRNAYGLTKESSPEIPLSEITLSCNPYYRYGANYTEEELEARLFEDTMKEFIS